MTLVTLVRFFLFLVCLALTLPAHALAAEPADGAEGVDTVERSQELGGIVKSKHELVVLAPMSGVITAIKASLDDTFKKGEALVRFDCSNMNAQMQATKAQLARANLADKMQKEAFKHAVVSEKEMLLSRHEAAAVAAQLQAAQAEMRKCSVIAPFSGQVVEVSAGKGDFVQQGMPLLALVDPKSLYIQMSVPEAEWNNFAQATTHAATVSVLGETVQATVTERSNFINDNQYFTVKLAFSSELPVTPGMRVVVR